MLIYSNNGKCLYTVIMGYAYIQLKWDELIYSNNGMCLYTVIMGYTYIQF